MTKQTFLIEKTTEEDEWNVFKTTHDLVPSEDGKKVVTTQETEFVEIIKLHDVPRQQLFDAWLLRIKPYLLVAYEINIKG